ncbi:MAG: S41 family peptidase [Bryobacteraceae bacterium]
MRAALLIALLAGLLSGAQAAPPPSSSLPEAAAAPPQPAAPAPSTAGRPDPNAPQLERELTRFLDVYATAAGNSADPPSLDQAIYSGAIPGMLRVLDPHSVFFNPDQFEQFQQMQNSVAKGFGSVVSLMPGRAIILQTQSGSPSQRAGLAPGDEILGVNDIPLARLDLDQLMDLLSASRQHPARIVVRRQGTAGLLTFTLIPAEMQAESVDRVYRIDDATGYVRVASFEAQTAEQLKKAIEKLGGAKLKALVLDLRNNPGGAVTAGLETAALFLPPGTRLLSVRGRMSEAENIDAPRSAQPYSFQLAVLVNDRTASAAEIVAAALQDNDRATLVGTPTFGKGLVERVFPLSEATGLALTTAFYYAPSGRSLQKPLRGSELDDVTRVQVRREFKTASGRIVRGGGGIEPDISVERVLPGRFGIFLESAGLYTAFATDWLSRHRAEAKPDLEITPAILDEFQSYLSQRNVRPSVSDWTAESELMRSRLKQEILNQSLGVEAGDEIEVRRDPAVRRALEKLAGQ